MESKWSEKEAESLVAKYSALGYTRDFALCLYGSRLIGSDTALVLAGGGNTSVKLGLRDDLGRETEALCVKASGRDLVKLEPADLPALRLEELRQLSALGSLSDAELANALRVRMLDSRAPNPSVEALLHAFLPHKYIDHSHPTAILSLVDQLGAEKLCAEIFGDKLVTVPYIMSGFGLAKRAADIYRKNTQIEGMLLLQHGLVTFGDTAFEAYQRHIQAVDAAQNFIRNRRYWATFSSLPPFETVRYSDLAPILRGRLSSADRRYILTLRDNRSARDFVDSPQLLSLSQRGVATADFVIHTKRVPLLLSVSGMQPEEIRRQVERSLADYREDYNAYVKRYIHKKGEGVEPLDPDPRVILVPGLGMIGVGETGREAEIAADIYQQTMEIIQNAEVTGGYHAISEEDTFNMEYWSLEQAKLGKKSGGALQGRVVYITGAASGIGAATARAFVNAGYEAFLVDREAEPLEILAKQLGCGFQVLDVTDEAAVRASVDSAVRVYGGLDGAVSNAGTASQGPIDTCPSSLLMDSIKLNLLAHQWVSSSVARVLRLQGTGGFLLYNASKAAFNPGAGFGPYAIPKAGCIALMKQYALELGQYGIRSNAVNADRIRTGLFSQELIQERARARGIETDAYFKANLLGREVTAEDVGQAFLSLALAQSTTGCVITVDGGNIAASPR